MKTFWFDLLLVFCLLLVPSYSSDPSRANKQQDQRKEAEDLQKQTEVEDLLSKLRESEKKVSELEQLLTQQKTHEKTLNAEKAVFQKEKEDLSSKVTLLEDLLSQQKKINEELENNLKVQREPLDKADELVFFLRGQYQLLNQHFWLTYTTLNDHLSHNVKPQLDELHQTLQQHYNTHIHPQLESAHETLNQHYNTHIHPQLEEAHQSLKPHLDELHQKLQPHLDELHQNFKPHFDELHQNLKPHIDTSYATATQIEEQLIQKLNQHLPSNFPTRKYLHYLYFMFSGLFVVWLFRCICCRRRRKI